MNQFEKKVYSYCLDNHMLEANDRVVVGVSGGADSVCLLFLLCAFRGEIPFSMRVVHVHHGIRPEAGRDAAYVKELCEKLEIPFEQVNADVPELAAAWGMTQEEAGRKVRYEAFNQCAMQYGETEAPVKIALAHHMGDRAETLLFHLFRGSGLKGLGSIMPVRDTWDGNRIIRPLLCVTKDEIEGYLKEKGVAFCLDATNFEDDHVRNRIRHHILPYAEKEICHGAERHLNEAAVLFAETESYLKLQTDQARKECVPLTKVEDEGLRRINISNFLQLHPLLQKRLLLELLYEISIDRKDIGIVHVEAVRDLFWGESGRIRNLPFGILARREYDWVILERVENEEAREELYGREAEIIPSSMSCGDEIFVKWGMNLFTFQCFPREKNQIIPEKIYTKWFDYDKIKGTLFIRTRRQGDYFMVRDGAGNPVRKMVKDYMITEKIPRKCREEIPLLTEGSHVLWITGRRISECYKVDDDTKIILQVKMNQLPPDWDSKE